jgi:hypothetical protein
LDLNPEARGVVTIPVDCPEIWQEQLNFWQTTSSAKNAGDLPKPQNLDNLRVSALQVSDFKCSLAAEMDFLIRSAKYGSET